MNEIPWEIFKQLEQIAVDEMNVLVLRETGIIKFDYTKNHVLQIRNALYNAYILGKNSNNENNKCP